MNYHVSDVMLIDCKQEIGRNDVIICTTKIKGEIRGEGRKTDETTRSDQDTMAVTEKKKKLRSPVISYWRYIHRQPPPTAFSSCAGRQGRRVREADKKTTNCDVKSAYCSSKKSHKVATLTPPAQNKALFRLFLLLFTIPNLNVGMLNYI